MRGHFTPESNIRVHQRLPHGSVGSRARETFIPNPSASWVECRGGTCLEARVFRPAVAAFQEHPAALLPKLSAALKGVETQLDALINDAVPMRKAG